MNISLHDGDDNGYPNLALMKLSAWHKSHGDRVDWFNPMVETDCVYTSKVFTFSQDDPYIPATALRGGTGYGMTNGLPHEVEHICPDYSLYGMNYSMGFLTRGCNRKCDWCVVPKKEGKVTGHADIEEFLRHKEVVLMDNNVLQSEWGVRQIEKIARLGVRVDFNQGLDCRMIDDGIARLLGTVKWRSPVRLACDHIGMIPFVHKAVELLRWNNVTPRRYFCYVLVKDVGDALERVKFLKGIDVDPFAQPFIDPSGNPPSIEQRAFARWVNHKAEFKSRTWQEYWNRNLLGVCE